MSNNAQPHNEKAKSNITTTNIRSITKKNEKRQRENEREEASVRTESDQIEKREKIQPSFII